MPPPAKTGLARARSKLGHCSRSQAWGLIEGNERLQVRAVRILRHGEINTWLEIILDEGKNHHIRRLLSALGVEALRLLRIAAGALPLGNLAKGQWRTLTPAEVRQLGGMHD